MEINEASNDMKKIINTIVILSSMVVAGACLKNGAVESNEEEQPVRFSGVVEESGTRTTLDESGRVLWEPGDAVNIFYDKNGWCFQSTVEEISATSDFVTNADYQEEGEGLFWAVYPYDKTNTYDGESVVLSVPAEQTATDGSFDRKAFVTLAQSSNHNLMFRNLCGGVEITVTTDYINRIVFKGNNDEILAGRVQVAFDSKGNPAVQKVVSGKTEVSLVAPMGQVFKKGSSYYISALPCDLTKGFTLEFYRDRTVIVDEAGFVSDRHVSVRRSVWGQVLRADEGSEWTIKIGDDTFAYKTASGNIVSIAESGDVKSHYFDEMSGYYLLTMKSGVSIGTLLSESDITEIVLPDNITTIDARAFAYCKNLTGVTIPLGVTSIGDGAFFYCTGLTSVTIPSSVTSIGNEALYGCTGLTSITIPSSVMSIGIYAFSSCAGLTSVIIPSSVTSIGSGAFAKCTGLTSVTIPSSVTSIGSGAFSNCTGLNSVSISSLEAWCVISFDNGYSNPLYYAHDLYLNDERLTSITIPSSVTSIGNYVFYGYTGLTSVTIPSSVTSIGSGAFHNCTGLTSVTIPSSVTSIGGSAFSKCTGLNSVSISSLEAWCVISFGNGYSNPLYYAHDLYLNGERLTSITIPSSVTGIGNEAFYGYTGLTSVTIPSSVTSIGSGAFAKCTGLTSVTIPSSVTSIGSGAFSNCTGLTSVTIPSSVTNIGNSAFSYCTGLTSVTIPSSVTNIGDMAFHGCTGLTSVTIPSSVTSIGGSAFSDCTGLTSVTIPSSVTSIEHYAFDGCTGLKTVYLESEIPPTVKRDAYIFGGCNKLKIYVPASAVYTYKVADGWSTYSSIIFANN